MSYLIGYVFYSLLSTLRAKLAAAKGVVEKRPTP